MDADPRHSNAGPTRAAATEVGNDGTEADRSRLGHIALAIDRLIERIATLFGYFAVLSTLALTFAVTYGVVMRFVFNSPRIWTEEVASYSLLWLVFFGLAHTLATNGHIRVDFFTRLLSERARLSLEVATWIIGSGFSVLLLVGSWSAIENFWRRNTHSQVGLEIPLYWPALPMLFGTALFSLVMLSRLVRLCVTREIPHATEHEATP